MLKNVLQTQQCLTGCVGKKNSKDFLKKMFTTHSCKIVEMEQTHGNQIAVVHTASTKKIKTVDAVITTQKNLALLVKSADCLPVLIYHPSGVVAAVHAGRAGTCQQVLLKTLEKVMFEFGLNNNLTLWFGPAIAVDSYHIANNHYFDLVTENTRQVRSYFLESEAKIIYSNIDTFTNPDYYSYRQEGPGVPMNWSGIALK